MYGLVLEGGGAKGAYHAGVYKAILEEKIEIGAITGTSVGAINGAAIVQGDYDLCYDLWHDIRYSMIMDIDDKEMERLAKLKFNMEDIGILADALKSLVSDRGIDIGPLRDMLDKTIDEDKIRNSKLDFGIVTVNLTDMKPVEIFIEDIPYGKLNDYLIASSYLPIFKSQRLGGKIYLDGAFYDNLPFRMLVNKGYKDLILVRTHARGFTRRILKDDLNAIIISPSEDIGRTLVFEQDLARQNLQLGYYDGLRAFRGLVGNKYYIKPKENKDYYLDLLLSIEEAKVDKIKELIKVPDLPYRRGLFEYIIPKLGSVLGLSKEFNYEDFVLALLERKCEEVDIDRFNIYTFEELLSEINCKSPAEKHTSDIGMFGRLIEKVDIATLFNREEILLEIADILFCNGK